MLKFQFQIKFIAYSVITFFFILSVTRPISGYPLITDVSNWSLDLLIKVYADEFRFTVFLSNNTHHENMIVHQTHHNTIDIIFATIQIIINTCRSLCGGLVDIFILASVVTAWFCARDFKKCVQSFNTDEFESSNNASKRLNSKEMEIQLVLSKYKIVKLIMTSINNACSVSVLFFAIESILHYANHLNEILVLPDWLAKLNVACFLINCISCLVLAADVCSKASWCCCFFTACIF